MIYADVAMRRKSVDKARKSKKPVRHVVASELPVRVNKAEYERT